MTAAGAGKVRRLFIALPLPEEVRRRLAGEARTLPERFFRPLKEENLHLTLAFLGDTPDPARETVEEVMGETAAAFAERFPDPVTAEIGGPGAFPHPGSPRVVWMGLARGAGEAGVLAEALGKGLRRAGLRFDGKPFAAHITIAYARRDLPPGGMTEAGEVFLDFLRRRGAVTRHAGAGGEGGRREARGAGGGGVGRGRSMDGTGGTEKTGGAVTGHVGAGGMTFPLGEMVLMESELRPGGSVFTPLLRAPLVRMNPSIRGDGDQSFR